MRDYLRKKRSNAHEVSTLLASSEQNRTQSRITKMQQQREKIAAFATFPGGHQSSIVDHPGVSTEAAEQFLTSKIWNSSNPENWSPWDKSRSRVINRDDYGRYNQAIAILGKFSQESHQAAIVRNGTVEELLYRLMAAFHESTPQGCIGSEIDPFHTLPQVPASRINIERLKKHCESYQWFIMLALWSRPPSCHVRQRSLNLGLILQFRCWKAMG
jgi:hypothetical protein